MLDPVDLRILTALQNHGRITNADVARELGMAPSAVLERIRKLEQKGIVQGYEARLDPKAIGLSLLAFVFVRAEEKTGSGEAGARMKECPEILEVHHVAGEDCYFVKLRARDPEDLMRIIRERIASIASVRSTRTTIVMGTIKESSRLSLEHLSEEGGHDAK